MLHARPLSRKNSLSLSLSFFGTLRARRGRQWKKHGGIRMNTLKTREQRAMEGDAGEWGEDKITALQGGQRRRDRDAFRSPCIKIK